MVVPMNTTTADHGRLSYRVPARECIDTPWIVSRGQPWLNALGPSVIGASFTVIRWLSFLPYQKRG